jgi:antitoxin component YwqK of YwqJK toxin-antitoxin module
MIRILFVLSLFVLASCGPSAEEKRQVEMEKQRIEQEASEKLAQEKAIRIAAVTCSIMGETRNMDAAVRVREMNNAREKIGGESFLRGDNAIKESFEYGLCQELVLNQNYDETIQPLKDARYKRERIAAEKRAEENRIAAVKRAKETRIAEEKLEEENRIVEEEKRVLAEALAIRKKLLAEQQRIAEEEKRVADSKPTIEEEFHSNGNLKSRKNYQSKSDGGQLHGLYVSYFEDGQLEFKLNMKEGKGDGVMEMYYINGQLWKKVNKKGGEDEGLSVTYDKQGQITASRTYKDGKKDGVEELFTAGRGRSC